MWSLYEIIHIWTAVVDESEEWSSQLIFQFKQLERKSLKKSGLQRDLNPRINTALKTYCSKESSWAICHCFSIKGQSEAYRLLNLVCQDQAYLFLRQLNTRNTAMLANIRNVQSNCNGKTTWHSNMVYDIISCWFKMVWTVSDIGMTTAMI